MARIVEFQYNPFLQRLRILIDGKQPPEYSRLIQYTDDDIWNWHSEILYAVYSELREDFIIAFVGMKSDASLIRYECSQHPHCVGFNEKGFIIQESLQRRLILLNKAIKSNEIRSYKRIIIDSLFIIPPSFQRHLEDILSIDISNMFCTVRVSTSVGKKDSFKADEHSFLFILTENIEDAIRQSQRYNSSTPVFIIFFGQKSGFHSSTKDCIIYETTDSDLMSTLFDCFLGVPLTTALRNCIHNMPNRVQSMADVQRAIATEPNITVTVEQALEVGKSNPITVTYDPPVNTPPKVRFHVINGSIATTDDICIFGKYPGETVLEAYCYGDKKPFQTCPITVFKRNRIQKVILDDDILVLGEGDTRNLHSDYAPVDADNADTMVWKSTDESVASITSYGRLMCHSTGECKLICTAENVSAQCTCIVKPYLQEIVISTPLNDNGRIEMTPAQEIPFKVNLVPDDCIDGELTYSSSDYDVVNIVNNVLYAKNKGTATITVKNQNNSKAIHIPVIVEKPKTGFFRSLFGK